MTTPLAPPLNLSKALGEPPGVLYRMLSSTERILFTQSHVALGDHDVRAQ
jgi:hypothetical protein